MRTKAGVSRELRHGLGCELNAAYFADACWHLGAAEQKARTPTLFDLDDQSVEPPPPEAGLLTLAGIAS